jgi:hypothetical protein
VLVWSETWRAEGEKGNFSLLSQAYTSGNKYACIYAERKPVKYDQEVQVRQRSPGLVLIRRSDNSPSFCYAATLAALQVPPGSKEQSILFQA